MSEPTSGGWASPGQDPVPPAAPQPAPPAPASAGPAPAPWQGQAGWGGAPAAPAAPPAWQGPAAPGQPAWQGQAGWGQAPGQGQAGWGAPGWGAPQAQAPRPGVVPLRPLGLGELLDGAVGLVRGYPRPALGVSAVVALVTTVVQLVLLLTLLRPLFDVDTLALEAGDTDALLGLLAGAGGALSVTVVFGTVSGAVMTGLMTAVAGRAVLGQPQTLGELWAGTRRALPRLVGASLLVALLVYGPPVLAGLATAGLAAGAGAGGAALGALLVLASLVLTVVLYVRLSLTTSVLVLEDASVGTALRRSWALVRRSFWRVLGVLLLTAVVAGFVSQVLQLPFALFAGDGGPFAALSGESATSLTTRSVVLSTIGTGVAALLVAPFTAGVTALLYVDRRMRAEGLDVALQAAAASRT